MMKILIAVASRHGSTYEIAEAIAEELRTAGHAVAVQNVEEIPAAGRYEAIIIGSAVYVGDWLPEAQRYVERNRARFAGVPVWLFSSGPLGEEPQPKGNPAHLDELVATTGARGHRIFVGKLDKSGLGLGERLMARAVKAPEGDFRDWPAIRAWAREIATTLEPLSVPTG
jgi:menaquinone-dependent protoporphyrinogen oxidase